MKKFFSVVILISIILPVLWGQTIPVRGQSRNPVQDEAVRIWESCR